MTLSEKTKLIQGAVGVAQDGEYGNKTADGIIAALKLEKPQGEASGRFIEGRGFKVYIEGDDLVVKGARCTCFGGTSDPQDSGDTASGISTKPPGTLGVALPRNYTKRPGSPTYEALNGSPIPESLPWNTMVEVTGEGQTHSFPLIDLGPNLKTTRNSLGVPNLIDLTVAAAKKFKPSASATNFEMICSYRIVNGAKFLS